MRGAATIVVLALALSGCGRGDAGFEAARVEPEFAATEAAPAPADVGLFGQGGGPAGAEEAIGPPPLTAVNAPMLAYVYMTAIETPYAGVEPMMRAHQQACVKAGPQVCQVIGANVRIYGEDSKGADLTLRAAPAWLETFRAGLEGEAKEAGGRITETSVTSEDLTRQIVDSAARVRALETLRGRLEALLRDRPGKLSELLELERELARVQGELDSVKSTLAVMRARVAMSEMTLRYQSKTNPVSQGAFAPIADAGGEFFRLLAETLALMIRAVAVLTPWALVLGVFGWLALRWRRARKLRRDSAEA